MQTKRILLFCPYPIDTVPGQRLKYEQYIDYLNNIGYEITILPFFSMRTFKILYKKGFLIQKICGVLQGLFRRTVQLCMVPRYDGIYIFLSYVPIGPIIFERIVRKLAKLMIYDIDDMIHLSDNSSVNKLVGWIRPSVRYFYLMKSADHVITCTPYLRELAQKHNSNVSDISSTVDTARYRVSKIYSDSERLIIGWSGSHSTIKYLLLLGNVLKQLQKMRNFKMLVFGCEEFYMDSIEVEVVPFSSEAEVPTLQRMDIGVYPLSDDEWVKGKSGLKAIQYMAVGLPVIASDVGCNRRVIADRVSGYLVKHEEEWLNALLTLIDRPDLRRQFGLAGRTRVEENFSVEKNKNKYVEVFDSVFLY